ncbi:MAG: 50S ribosomal protein L3 [Firmicutes bacterium ADurb.Bin080]|jgi:large subunit ribosomal protein L3|nr:50S ribosomal protein L3 [Clostridiales bacterium]OQC15591.1 MAG: 50S ribosomal protein L3 [Firmicutes bacterium ADurb.Bin080]
MQKAIIGKKLGMSQIFTPDGTIIPVSVILAGPCTVVQVKTAEKDGYSAVKVGFEEVAPDKVNKPNAGQFKKSNLAVQKVLREMKLDNSADYSVGDKIGCSIFSVGDHVDVTGNTRGRGFSGTIQRWGTHRGPMAHGSGYHRGVGSLSANSSPSRVFKNKKMPGQYGNEKVTIQNLEVVRVDEARNVLLISGGIPGAKGSIVFVKSSCKSASGSRWIK